MGTTKPQTGFDRPAALSLIQLTVGITLMFASAALAQSPGTFSLTGDMSSARFYFAATRLLNDQTMVSGGESGESGSGIVETPTVDLYNPYSQVFSPTGSMLCAMSGHTATLLTNGNVLIVGGTCGADTSSDTVPAELWTASSGTFADTGRYRGERRLHSASRLVDGRILIAGGVDAIAGDTTNLADVYDPAGGTFSPTGNLNFGRNGHTSILLKNGLVLIAGGNSFVDGGAVTTSEVFDPSTGQFIIGPSMNDAAGLGAQAVPLRDGQVLVAGGLGGGSTATNAADIYNPLSNSFSATGPMQNPRYSFVAAALDNFSVLAAGTINPNAGITTASELFSPLSLSFATTGSLNDPRLATAGGILPNGQVLVAGGFSSSVAAYSNAEVYTPPTMPEVRISTPSPYSVVEGTVNVFAEKNSDVLWINAYVDGNYLASGPPLEFSWDSTTVHNGLHYLSVVGFNSSGQKAGTDTLLVKVINGTNVALTQPIANQTVYGQILIVTEMSPATTWEDVYIDGNYFASGPPLLFTWDTTTVGNGVHTVSVAGFDSSGNVIGFDDDNVRVENGDALITFPQSGNQVAGTVLVDTQPLPADQWENLYVDGQYLQSGPPYNFIWDSTTVGNGSHTLSLRAFSSASGQVGADSIPIVVAN